MQLQINYEARAPLALALANPADNALRVKAVRALAPGLGSHAGAGAPSAPAQVAPVVGGEWLDLARRGVAALERLARASERQAAAAEAAAEASNTSDA